METILYYMKQFLHRSRHKDSCRFGSGVRLDSRVEFEGHNFLADKVTFLNSSLGKYSYISTGSFIKNARIGRFCSIGNEVATIAGRHPVHYISTHPVFYSPSCQSGISFTEEAHYEEFHYLDPQSRISLQIGNDVWIGARTLLMEHITIGDGAVIAAGSVVTKDIPPYAIAGGVPARVIRYRFSEEEIRRLQKLAWWDKEEDWLRAQAGEFLEKDHFLEKIK